MRKWLLSCWFVCTVSISYADVSDPWFYYGEFGGRLISESGKINRDLTLLEMKKRADTLPFMIVGGDFLSIVRYPKRDNKPLYLFDKLSAELENMRMNTMINFSEDVFFAANYQFNGSAVLDAFVTWGNLKKSPYYLTLGKQYLPYGDFNKYDVEANPLNKTVFRISQAGATFGYKKGVHHLTIIAAPDFTRLAFAYEHTRVFNTLSIVQSVGIISNIVDGNRALKSLRPISHHAVPAIDCYTIFNYHPYRLHVELNSALTEVEHINHLTAYNLEGEIRFYVFNRPSKFIVSTSGLLDAKKLNYNEHFNALGIFTRQYVLSMKHQLYPHITIGLAGILGQKLKYEEQVVLNLVIKV